MPTVPVIDLFAGPGGLGEGFSAFQVGKSRPFDVRLSIEKEPVACATLTLRKFFRQFKHPPPELQAYFTGDASLEAAYGAYPTEAELARAGVWNAELGSEPAKLVARKVQERLQNSSNWVLLGGPPCQAYSIAGRSRMRSTRPDFESDERHLLYREYLRIVAEHEPAVFVLENVKGLLTSKHGGTNIVTRILEDLWAPAKAIGIASRHSRGYRLYALGQRQSQLFWMDDAPQDGEEYLVKAEEFGIPQMRHRIFIVGVRADIPGRPAALQRRPEVSAEDVLGDLPRIRSGLTKEDDSAKHWQQALRAIQGYDWMSARQPEFAQVIREIRKTLKLLPEMDSSVGSRYIPHRGAPSALGDWYRHNAEGLTLHESRGHMRSDLHRYLFAAAYGAVHSRSPELQHFPIELRPAHNNVTRAIDEGGAFNDRFRVQLRRRPSTTITSHISKDGHYYIHYDPLQCRSLTVREAARLQTFPDSYFFEGNRTQQYHQIGNAVPPLLAREIARVVHDLLESADVVTPSPPRIARRDRRQAASG